jgi:prophage regulatory protein
MTNDNGPPIEGRLLKIDQVMEIAGLGKTMIYRKVRDGTFPRPCKPGGASTRWDEGEVRQWKAEVLAARDAA